MRRKQCRHVIISIVVLLVTVRSAVTSLTKVPNNFVPATCITCLRTSL